MWVHGTPASNSEKERRNGDLLRAAGRLRAFPLRLAAQTSPKVKRVRWKDISPFAMFAQANLFGILHPQHMLGGCLAGLAYDWVGRRTRCGCAPVWP